MNAAEEQRIGSLAENETEERNKLVMSHINYAYHLAWKFIKRYQIRHDEQETIRSVATFAMVKASRKFKASYGRFTTYAHKLIIWHLLDVTKELSKNTNSYFFSEETPLNHHVYSIEKECDILIDYGKVKELLLSDLLDERERKVIYEHYIEGKSVITLAEELDLTRHRIYMIEKKALRKLRRCLD